MDEWLKSKRVKFLKGKQKAFIRRAIKIMKLSNNEMADLLNISVKTLTDWKREKFLMPLLAVKKILTKIKIKFPKNIKIKNRFWYAKKGAKIGGTALYKKYGFIGGNPDYRKMKWREWWENKGKFKKHPLLNARLFVKKPVKSEKLSEFIGIVLGDGGISKYQITITLHHSNDKEYCKFVVNLIKELFGITPSVYHKTKYSVNNIIISRAELVDFFTKKLELKIGNKIKQQIDIPRWIKKNKKFQIACVRGLIDTDGSIFIHNYTSNKKRYHYKKLDFTSMSKPLCQSVYNILKKNGLNPRFSRNKSVQLDSIDDMKKYFRIIGSHNPKHLKKYYN